VFLNVLSITEAAIEELHIDKKINKKTAFI